MADVLLPHEKGCYVKRKDITTLFEENNLLEESVQSQKMRTPALMAKQDTSHYVENKMIVSYQITFALSDVSFQKKMWNFESISMS